MAEKFKCPLGDRNKCPDHELFHYAANKVMIENAQYVNKIKELRGRLEAAYREIDAVVNEMYTLAREPIPTKENKG